MARPTPGTRLGRAVKLGLATTLAAAAVPLSAGMAQAGGSEPAKLPHALESVKSWVEQRV